MKEPHIVEANPFRCTMWPMHDRLTEYMDERSCAAELESFRTQGQQLPTLGRPLHNDPNYEIELIYGARRLYIARQLNVKLLVELREISDREAIISMDIENRHRKDISPYERGMNLKALLRENYFASQSDLSKALGISEARVSRLLKFSEIPYVVIDAFPSPLEIRETWGVRIANWLTDSDTRERLLTAARRLRREDPGLSAEEVFRRLLEAASSSDADRRRRTKHSRRDEVIKDASGRTLFRVSRRHRDVHVVLPLSVAYSDTVLRAVKTALTHALTPQEGRPATPSHGGDYSAAHGTARQQIDP